MKQSELGAKMFAHRGVQEADSQNAIAKSAEE